MNELVFEVAQDPDGGYVAEHRPEAETWEELRRHGSEAVEAHYFGETKPASYDLQLGSLSLTIN